MGPLSSPPGSCRFHAPSLDVLLEPGCSRSRQAGVPASNPDHEEERQMRVMIVMKANQESEAGIMPSQALLEEMGKYNEELVKAGVMLAGDGLHASSKGARVRFSGGKATVIDGPFAETKELIAGYWLWPGELEGKAIEGV